MKHFIFPMKLCNSNRQEQSPKVLCKKESCSQKFGKIHREIIVLEFLFNKVEGLQLY